MFKTILQTMFMYIGVYSTITAVWTLYELAKFKEKRTSNRDTIIALVLSLIITGLVR